MDKDDANIVLKPREFPSDLLLPQNSDELAKFMDGPLIAVAESITGALAAGPQAWMVMTGRIVQGILTGRMLQGVSREIKDLREKGKIPSDFGDEKKNARYFQSWVELLTTIDADDPPDPERLEALKAMFYGANKAGLEDAERNLNYWLFQIAKTLTSSELILLRAMYECGEAKHVIPHADWSNHMSTHLGHNIRTLILRDLRKLEGYALADSSTASDSRHATVEPGKATLTDLGLSFYKNIKTYQLETSSE